LNTKQIVITGGPGTGKSSIINELLKRGYPCMEEVSRQVTLEARKNGIEQLFLTEPLRFSELLLEARLKQFHDSQNAEIPYIFIDRGMPDVLAYMDYASANYPDHFTSTCEAHRYHSVFNLAPWETIFISDSERYEDFDQAVQIHEQLVKTYERFGYHLIDVPFESIEKRADFILNFVSP
jgi:predicted ATPase